MKTYEISVKGKYWSKPESLFIEACTAREAISMLRRKARIEMWYDKRNDGPISYTNKAN